MFFFQATVHFEGGVPSGAQEQEESQQRKHGKQDLLLHKGHSVPCT